MERELRHAHHRKSDTWIFASVLVAPVLLFSVYELGRTTYFMKDVKSFAATLDQRPSVDVKRDLNRYARNLSDYNPMIRNGSIMAMKLATRWNPGSLPGDWRQMWAEQEPYGEYHRAAVTNHPAEDWRSQLPEKPATP